jgi:hypothetical protein
MMNSALCGMRAMFSWPRSTPGSGNAANPGGITGERPTKAEVAPLRSRPLDYHRVTARLAKIDVNRSEATEYVAVSAVRTIVRADFIARQGVIRIAYPAHPPCAAATLRTGGAGRGARRFGTSMAVGAVIHFGGRPRRRPPAAARRWRTRMVSLIASRSVRSCLRIFSRCTTSQGYQNGESNDIGRTGRMGRTERFAPA